MGERDIKRGSLSGGKAHLCTLQTGAVIHAVRRWKRDFLNQIVPAGKTGEYCCSVLITHCRLQDRAAFLPGQSQGYAFDWFFQRRVSLNLHGDFRLLPIVCQNLAIEVRRIGKRLTDKTAEGLRVCIIEIPAVKKGPVGKTLRNLDHGIRVQHLLLLRDPRIRLQMRADRAPSCGRALGSRHGFIGDLHAGDPDIGIDVLLPCLLLDGVRNHLCCSGNCRSDEVPEAGLRLLAMADRKMNEDRRAERHFLCRGRMDIVCLIRIVICSRSGKLNHCSASAEVCVCVIRFRKCGNHIFLPDAHGTVRHMI